MRGWVYVTPEGERSKPFATYSDAVIEAVYFCAFRLGSRLGVLCSFKRLSPAEAQSTFRDLEPEGWKIEGVR